MAESLLCGAACSRTGTDAGGDPAKIDPFAESLNRHDVRAGGSDGVCRLRILTTNDVYELDNLPMVPLTFDDELPYMDRIPIVPSMLLHLQLHLTSCTFRICSGEDSI